MQITRREHIWYGKFNCMASPCEVLIETEDEAEARHLIEQAQREALRIEYKFSRYRDDNIVFQIHQNPGRPISIDEETYRLLQFADNCYQLSDGLFDITSGVLRRLWNFKGEGSVPRQSEIDQILRYIGWNKVSFNESEITLPEGMQIDFGGIGKEYAVDRVLLLLTEQSSCSMMINFGGDCHANAPQKNGQAWVTGIENPLKPGDAAGIIRINHGALATSGDVYRFIEKNGKRYSHILNPKTGWPVINGPRSVTVAAATCTEAGILSTLAMLQGKKAESFLKKQKVKYWCYR
jgi:FAD:protein FMN transferase